MLSTSKNKKLTAERLFFPFSKKQILKASISSWGNLSPSQDGVNLASWAPVKRWRNKIMQWWRFTCPDSFSPLKNRLPSRFEKDYPKRLKCGIQNFEEMTNRSLCNTSAYALNESRFPRKMAEAAEQPLLGSTGSSSRQHDWPVKAPLLHASYSLRLPLGRSQRFPRL